MKLIKFLGFVLGFIVCVSTLSAQEIEPIRLELPVQLESSSYRYELLGEQGLLLFYESNELDSIGKRKWYFSLIDTNLTEKWIRFLLLEDGMKVQKVASTNERVAIILTNSISKKQDAISYEIVSYNITNSKFGLLGGTFPAQAEIADAELAGDKLMIGLNLKDYLADFLLFDLKTGALTTLDASLDGQLLIREIGASEAQGVFVAAVKQFENKRYKADVFLAFDSRGNLRRQYKPDGDQSHFLAAIGFAFVDNDIIALGSFERESKRAATLKDVDGNPEREAIGVFYLRLKADGVMQSQFYRFNQIPNIDKILAREDLLRLRQLQSRGKITEQTEISFQFFKPEILNLTDQLVFAAEAFQPQYRIESRIDYDFYGRPIPYTYTIFEGYNFFNTLIVSFDKSGNINWINGFRMENLLTFQLENHVAISKSGNELLSALFHNGSLQSKLFHVDGKAASELEKLKVDLRFPNDRLLEEHFGRIYPWYDAYYLVAGNQKISNNRLRITNPRSVFFLQKLVFE
ncbi:MAG: hypothetical protein M0Q90_09540 [Bacteroidales bacterium]|nr:hypothetical protein [Bacteroidales bacterium]